MWPRWAAAHFSPSSRAAPLRSRLQAINEFCTLQLGHLASGLTGWVYAQLGWQAILLMGIALLAALFASQWSRKPALQQV